MSPPPVNSSSQAAGVIDINPSFPGSSIERQSQMGGGEKEEWRRKNRRTLGFATKSKRPADNHRSGKLIAPLQGCLAKRQPGKKMGLPSHPERDWGGGHGSGGGLACSL